MRVKEPVVNHSDLDALAGNPGSVKLVHARHAVKRLGVVIGLVGGILSLATRQILRLGLVRKGIAGSSPPRERAGWDGAVDCSILPDWFREVSGLRDRYLPRAPHVDDIV